jgi:uncharacterized protein (DUF2267 family)
MNYRSYIDQVMKLPFINDAEAADSAIKAVLGVLASRLDEREARRLTDILPPELNYATLRGHQVHPVLFSTEEFIALVAHKFQLNRQQAGDLVFRVLHCVKESEEGAEAVDDVRTNLPADWGEVLDRA